MITTYIAVATQFMDKLINKLQTAKRSYKQVMPIP